jgi:hypothetical protein
MIRGLFGDESRRPYRTAGLWVFGYPGFHPGLFSFAPSGSNGEACGWWAARVAESMQYHPLPEKNGEGWSTRLSGIVMIIRVRRKVCNDGEH